MCAHVLGQVVITHEHSGAQSTAELFSAGVGLKVALQFIRACEPLAAEKPVTDEWPVPAVPPQVSLEMGGLGVGFATAGDVTVVHVLPPAVVCALSHLLSMDTVWAATHGLAGTPRRRATLRLRAGRDRVVLWFLHGERFLLQYFRCQGLHFETILGIKVR